MFQRQNGLEETRLSQKVPETDEDKQKRLGQLGAYLTIPFVLAVSPIVGWLIGSWLDRQFDTAPYLMYLFLLLGFIAGFRELYRIVKRFGDEP